MASTGLARSPSHSTAVSQLTQLLDTTWQITLKEDNRTFVGRFVVVDREKNVILDDASEMSNGRTRTVGLIMIPGARIASAELDRDSVSL
ncbi:MAG: hypothetical protein CYPHOPRED_000660 [Cyphobasidiales sp. Tagirdzhanova-0007]|nr:MAG: hypothetical protein CYPHOPRED_000660 [Cyphobasidiales sp. Tagirdzhanova-0007]